MIFLMASFSKLVMYADDTTLFNSTERPKVNSRQRQQLCDALNKDLQTIIFFILESKMMVLHAIFRCLVAFSKKRTPSLF